MNFSGGSFYVIRATRKETELQVILTRGRKHTTQCDSALTFQKRQTLSVLAAFLRIVMLRDQAKSQKSEYRSQL